MKRLSKGFAVVLTSFFLALLFLPLNARAESVDSGTFGDDNNLQWELEPDGVLTISGKGAMSDFSNDELPPWKINHSSDIKKIIISEGVSNIGDYAFRYLENLEQVVIRSSITSIGGASFSDCINLTDITLPDSVTTIGNMAFYQCQFTEFKVPDGTTEIGDAAFENCAALEFIEIPSSVKSIGDAAFYQCRSLKEINLVDGIESIGFYAFYGCYALKKATLPGSIKHIGERTFEECSYLSDVTIMQGIEEISDYMFYKCGNLKNIVIPEGVTKIGSDAFSYSGLTSISLPNSVTDIGGRAFKYCYSLHQLDLPSGLVSLGFESFSSFGITEISLPSSLEWLPAYSFLSCGSLTSIYIPKSITVIGDYSFQGCNALKDVYYEGTEEEWNNIEIGEINENFVNAEIHYNYLNSDYNDLPSDDTTEEKSKVGIIDFISPNENYSYETYYKRYTFSLDAATVLFDVEIESDATWELYTDDECTEESKSPHTVDLKMGINYYYIKVICGDESEIYTVKITRGTGYSIESLKLDFADNSESILWGDGLFNETDDAYVATDRFDKNLAVASLFLCDQAQSGSTATESALQKLGFSEHDVSRYYDDSYTGAYEHPAFSIGARKISVNGLNDKVVVAMVIRGTRGDSLLNTIEDFMTKDAKGGAFNGFLDAGENTYKALKSYIESNYSGYNKSNIILYIQGHSLGGAVAGQVSRFAYNDGYTLNNTYTYTFASPNYDTQNNNIATFNNVFNVLHDKDVVPDVPWGYKRIGTDVIYSNVFSLGENLNIFNKNILTCHITSTYFRCLKYGNKTSKRSGVRVVIDCPVDIKVYDNKDDFLIAETRGETTSYYGAGDIFVFTVGEQKRVYSVEDAGYTINFTGTGAGSMQYTLSKYSFSDDTETVIRQFSDVVLENGKTFSSDIDGENLNETNLYVTDSTTGTTLRAVESDGTEKAVNLDNIFIVGQKLNISSRFSNGKGKIVKYTSSAKKIATISKKGVLTAKKAGENIKITAYIKNGKKYEEVDSLTIHIQKPQIKTVGKLRAKGETFDIAGAITGTSLKPSGFKSSKPSVLSVDSKGVITAKTSGKATITAFYGNSGTKGKAKIKVTVKIPKLNKTKASVKAGKTLKLKLKNTDALPVFWSSSDEAVVLVDQKGKVNAISAGRAVVTATFEGTQYTCQIDVK